MFSHNEDYSHMPGSRVVPPHKDLVAIKKNITTSVTKTLGYPLMQMQFSFGQQCWSCNSLKKNNIKLKACLHLCPEQDQWQPDPPSPDTTNARQPDPPSPDTTHALSLTIYILNSGPIRHHLKQRASHTEYLTASLLIGWLAGKRNTILPAAMLKQH